jgi:hypothetical protein
MKVLRGFIRICSLLFAGLALLLLTLNVIGAVQPPLGEECQKRSGEIENYSCRTLSLFDAKRELEMIFKRRQQISSDEIAKRLYTLVSRSYVHSEKSYVTQPWDNWLIWLQSMLAERPFVKNALRDSQDPVFLWNRGSGFCHQASWIYLAHLRALGIPGRLVRIPGHYLVTLLKDDGTPGVLVDVDLGVFWGLTAEELLAREESENLIAVTLSAQGFPEKKVENIVATYRDGLPQAQTLDYLYTRELFAREILTRRVLWTIPLFLLVVAVALEGAVRFFSSRWWSALVRRIRTL